MPDPTVDPCGHLAQLYSVRAQLALQAGRQRKVVEVEGANGSRSRVEFHAADIKALDAEIRRFEALCAKAGSGRPVRSAFRFG